MRYPALQQPSQKRIYTDAFRGLYRQKRTGDGTFWDMKNMGAEEAVTLRTRQLRATKTALQGAQGIGALEELIWIDGGTLFIAGEAVMDGISEGEKDIVTMGAYVIAFPDGAYYNTMNPEDHGYINRLYKKAASEAEPVELQVCDVYGAIYEDGKLTVGPEGPEAPEDGDLWIDTGMEEHVMRRWNKTLQEWESVPAVYTRISADGIGAGLQARDVVEISGLAWEGESEVIRSQVERLNGSMIVMAAEEDAIVVTGLIDQVVRLTDGEITVNREMPQMDFVIECNNRLWGCRYGEQGGQLVNEIYASCLGDFRNWKRYGTEAGDAYAMSCGMEGCWTGAISYRGYPYFFKEGGVYKVFGERPSNYQAQITALEGVREGAHKTLQVVNGSILYLSRHGVYMLDTVPTDLSAALGEEAFRAGAAGEYDGRYYISMEGEKTGWGLYVLNAGAGQWYKQDELQVLRFAKLRDSLYALCADGRILDLMGRDGEKEKADALEWMIEWNDDGNTSQPMQNGMYGLNHKYFSRYNARLYLSAMTRCDIEIMYDNDDVWHAAGSMETDDVRRVYTIPILPRRCDRCRIRIMGMGEMELYGIDRIMTKGGDGQ